MAWRKQRATSTLCSSWRNKSLAPRLLLECRGCVDHFDTRALGPTSSCPKQLKTRHITNLSVQPDGGMLKRRDGDRATLSNNFLWSIQLLRWTRLSGTSAFSAIIERTAETDLPLWSLSAVTSIP